MKGTTGLTASPKIAAIASVVVVLGVGGALGWRAWTRSPTYSLKQFAAAVEHRDRYEFEKYVDVDALLQAVVADASDGNALASAFGGAVVTNLKPQIIKAIEDGGVSADSRFGKGLEKVREPGFSPNVERQGRNAYFAVPITTNGGAPFSLRFHLTQVPEGHWRVDRIANLKDLHAVEAEEESARKAAIAKANAEKLAKLHVVARLHTSHKTGPYGWERKNRFQIRFENKDDKEITGMTGRLRFPAHEYDEGIKGNVRLGPGQADTFTWESDVNRFMEATERVFALGETDAFEVDIESLTYADGARVRRGSEED